MSNNAIDQFRVVLAARGIVPDAVDADGRLHRVGVEGGKSGREDGAYVLHLDGLPSGGFINWRDGLGWQTWSATLDREPSREERAAWRKRADDIRRQRDAETTMRYTEAAVRAADLFAKCKPATNDHPYLCKKGVGAYGVRQLREQLVIPLRDAQGDLCSLQFIGPSGEKKFLTGGRKRGCYYAIGILRGTLCICEGYATAASIHEATGHAVAVAFDAGNLEPVALALRKKFPEANLIICADNDIMTTGNPGVSRAIAAAKAAHGRVAIPHFYGAVA